MSKDVRDRRDRTVHIGRRDPPVGDRSDSVGAEFLDPYPLAGQPVDELPGGQS
jgi:hypothetical protein